jgi:hypothetical protein
MARFPWEVDVAAYIAARIAAYPTECDPHLAWLAPYVAEFAALPCYVGWFETIALRVDREFIRWSTEGDYSGARPVDDRRVQLSSLVEGAQRYPGLRVLLPVRGPLDADCWCLQHPDVGSGKRICPTCCGLGWVTGARP